MKICKECGSRNPDSDKHCSECGTELNDNFSEEIFICKKCGTGNKSRSIFCLNCGAELDNLKNLTAHNKTNNKSGQKQKRSKHRQEHIHHNYSKYSKLVFFQKLKAVWVIPLIIIVSIGIAGSLDLLFHKYDSNKSSILEMQNIDPLIKAQVYAVASKFQCTCGKCKDKLSECDCEKAFEERNFIMNNLENGKDQIQVSLAINKKYGGLIQKSL